MVVVVVKFSVSPIPEIPALDDQDGIVAKIQPRMNKKDGGWFRLNFTQNKVPFWRPFSNSEVPNFVGNSENEWDEWWVEVKMSVGCSGCCWPWIGGQWPLLSLASHQWWLLSVISSKALVVTTPSGQYCQWQAIDGDYCQWLLSVVRHRWWLLLVARHWWWLTAIASSCWPLVRHWPKHSW